MPAAHQKRDEPEPADESTAIPGGWLELQVANPSFLVDELGAECTDLQGLRELTVNAIEAIAARGPGAGGRVVCDLDWERFESSGRLVAGALSCPLCRPAAASSRARATSASEPKVAAGSRCPHGLEWRSWHQGEGALALPAPPRRPLGARAADLVRRRIDFWRLAAVAGEVGDDATERSLGHVVAEREHDDRDLYCGAE